MSVRCTPYIATVLLALLGCEPPALQAQRALLVPAPGSPLSIEHGPGSVALAEMNQDGKSDLVSANGRSVTVLLGEGDGRFRIAPQSPFELPGPCSEMVVGDVNGDGQPDVVTSDLETHTVTVLLAQ